MKTNKSYSQRLKVTRQEKVLARKPGKNHFNAKAPRVTQLNAKGLTNFNITNKSASRFLPKTK